MKMETGVRDEARAIIVKLEAAGCPPALYTNYKGWVDMHRPVEAIESRVLGCSIVEYERATPTGLRPIRSWSWHQAKFGNAEHQRAEEIVRGIK